MEKCEYVIERPVVASFEPQQDITAYELATLLPYLFGKALYQSDWDSLGAAQRHMKRHE